MESDEARNKTHDTGRARPPAPVPIYRAPGQTEAERYLKRLAEHSYSTLQTYSGLYRAPGKELCDLLVVFRDYILIFSDKAPEFRNSGDLESDWSRWSRVAIQESAKQVRGAERWMREQPGQIFLDPACRQRFPLDLPGPARAKIHRIIVAHGASARCKQERGGSGSLRFDPAVLGAGPPFTIGQIDPAKGVVHVLDDISLPIIMNTLDTITDLVLYLEKKEAFITSGRLGFAAREEDLLAYYLAGPFNQQGERDFVIPPDTDGLDGLWERFDAGLARRSQRRADAVSYEWDAMIDYFNRHALAGTAYYTSSSEVNDQARILSFLAQEPRLRRRALALGLRHTINNTPADSLGTGFVNSGQKGEPHYVFLVHRGQRSTNEAEYRARRRKSLEDDCLLTKLEYPDAQDIIGLAVHVGLRGPSFEDVAYLDGRQWNAALRQEAERIQRSRRASRRGALPKVTFRELEYPIVGLVEPSPVKSVARLKQRAVPKKPNRLPRRQRKK